MWVESVILRVSEYDAITGAVINPNLITGLYEAEALGASGQILFVAHTTAGFPSQHTTVGEYNATTGVLIDSDFIALNNEYPLELGLVVSGSSLFAVPVGSAVAEYNATTGAVTNANFITGAGLDFYGYAIAIGPVPGAPTPSRLQPRR